MGRKKARDNAFKCVYQLEFMGKDKKEEILEKQKESSEEEKEILEKAVEIAFEALQ